MEPKEGALAVIGTSVILILLGLFTGSVVFYAAAAISVILLALDYYSLVIATDDLRKRLDVTYSLSRNEIFLGASTKLDCRLAYDGSSSRTVQVRQKLDDTLKPDSDWGPIKLSQGSTRYLSLALHPSASGIFTIPPPEIEAESRLFRDSYTIDHEYRLNVLLPLGAQIQRIGPPASRTRRRMGIFEATIAKKGHGADFSSIRKYEPGDSLKRIDWIRSARSHGLMIRDFEDDQPLPAFFIIDLSPSMGQGEDRSGLTSSVRLTTALFNKIYVNLERTSIICFSPSRVERYLPPRIGSAQLHGLRDLLSGLKAADAKHENRSYQQALPYELKSVFQGDEGPGALINETLQEYLANIQGDGFSRAIAVAIKAVNTPSRLFIMTDLSMGMMSLVNNLRIAKYYGHKVSVVLMPHAGRDESLVESLEMLQKLKAYGIEATVMSPDDTPEDVIRRGSMAFLSPGMGA